MKNKIFTTKIKSIAFFFLLFFGSLSTSFAQNTIEVSGSCITDTVVFSEAIENDGKMAYTGTGTIFGIENTQFALWWDAAEAKWLLALDGQAYWYNSDNTDLPNSTLLIGNWTQDDESIGTCDLVIEGSGTNMPVCEAPAQATAASFGTVTENSIQLNSFTAPVDGADGYLIKVNTSNSFTAPDDAVILPVYDTVYGGGEQIVYAGTSNIGVSVSGLNPGTNYFFKVYAYNYCTDTFTYETTGLLAEQRTLKADQIITFAELEAKTYGDADFDLSATASSDLAVSYVSSNSLVATVLGNTVSIVGHGSTDITASQSGNTGFNPAPDVIKVLSVNKKVISITGLTAENKIYDATTDATISGGEFSGVVSNDVLTLDAGTGTFEDKMVGDDKTVTLTAYAMAGEDTINYILTAPTELMANITPATLSIAGSFKVADKEFDGNSDAIITENNLTLQDVINNDAVELINPVAKFAQMEVGENIVVSLTEATLNGVDKSNYILSLENSPTTTASISVGVNINETGSITISVYPNPFSETINITGSTSVLKLRLTNLLGQILLEKTIDSEGSLNTSYLKSGVYFLSIEDENSRNQIIKMIKE